jgi:hypothetical protein
VFGGAERQQRLAASAGQFSDVLPHALPDAAATGLHAGADPLQVAPARLDRRN